MKRLCRSFCLLVGLAASGSAAVNVVVSGGVLRDASGTALPAGSLVALVASTQDDVFSSPVPSSPFQVGTTFGGDDVVLAIFPVDAVSTAVNGGCLGIASLDYAAMGIPNFGAGDRLALYWFPPSSLSNGQILLNAAYGLSSTTWLAPDDSSGGVVELNFLTAAIGGTVSDSAAFAALTVGAGGPTLQFAQASSQISENGVTVALSVTRVGGGTGAVSVQYSTTNGTAIAPDDYTSASGTLNWANGDLTSRSITVTIVNDSTAESSESFTVVLSNPTGGVTLGSPNTATVTIQDDDPPVGETAYVTNVVPGTLRNDYSGWVGMQIVVGASPLTVSELGRWMVAGNTGTHTVKLVKASDGLDVPGGSVAIAMSGGTPGQFRYGTLGSPVVLAAGTTYFVLSQETSGQDTWHDWNTLLTTTSVATDNAVVWGTGPGTWAVLPVANQGIVPVNFKYSSGGVLPEVTVAATDATAGEPGSGQGTGTFTFTRTGSTASGLTVNFTVGGTATSGADYTALGTTATFSAGSATATAVVSVLNDAAPESSETVVVTLAAGTGYTIGSPSTASVTIQDDDPPVGEVAYVTNVVPGTLRNDYSGWVGMQIVVGASPLTVSELGRWMVAGNTGTHTVKLVKASDGLDVPGGSVAIAMSGGTPGQFRYGTLGSPVVLAAGTTYFVLSQETSGQDTWHDWNTLLTTTSVATDNAVVWGTGPGTWAVLPVANQGIVPVNFKYSSGGVLPEVTVAATDATAGEPGSGQGTGTFTFTRTGSTASGLTVNFTVGGTATSGADYTALGTTATFSAGSATATAVVSVLNDAAPESSETVVVTLAAGTGYTIGSPSTASVTIQDDDPPVGEVAYVTNVVPGTLRNDYSGWVGMQIVVGASPLTVSELGRWMVAGNTGTHTVKLVKASDGLDVPGGSVAIAMSGGTPGQFRYGTLGSPVVLAAGTTYFVLSQETSGQDMWHDWNTQLTTTSVATDNAVVWGTGPGTWAVLPVANQGIVPVNFKYGGAAPAERTLTVSSSNPNSGVPITVSPVDSGAQGNGVTSFTRSYLLNTTVTLTAPASASGNAFQKWQRDGVDWAFSLTTIVTMDAAHTMTAVYVGGAGGTAYVTNVVLGTLRNDFSGWVGMQIVVGASPLTVSELGRWMVAGNTGTHTVKLVKASDGLDVPGGSVAIAMSGGTPGQFRYGTLGSPVVLAASTTYFVLSQETSGQDAWCHWDTLLTTTSVATDNGVVWGTGPGTWQVLLVANQGFVPVNFKY